MARQTAWSEGEKITAARLNECQSDYVSQSDAGAQSVEGDFQVKGNLTVDGTLTVGKVGIASGSSPIKVAHGLAGVTTANTGVSAKVLATQTYETSYNVDATYAYIYHNKVGSATVFYQIIKFA